MPEITHLPVLVREVIGVLEPKVNGTYVDATVGLGGHAEEILKFLGPEGKLIGIDKDEVALRLAEKRLQNTRVVLKRGDFSDLEFLISQEGISKVDGILFDLGVSMLQIKDPERGFSFTSDNRLDMRMDKGQELSAWDVVNRYPQKKLEKILREFGEEPLSRKISEAIIKMRSKKTIDTCLELAEMIKRFYTKRRKIHPATKTFQALRIEVNKEIDKLRAGFDSALRLLNKGGRFCVISYHSLEDRAVKNFISHNAKEGLLKVITKKPMVPRSEEIRINPSSRSAKLRAAEKT